MKFQSLIRWFQSSDVHTTTSMNCKNQNDSWSKRKRNDDSLNERKWLARVDAAKNIVQDWKSFDVELLNEILDNQWSE